MNRQERTPHFEAAGITTRDGTQLAAEIYTSVASEPRGGIIFVHGFGGNKRENGLFSTIAEQASIKGFNSVLYDWRGIEQSQGEFHSTTLRQHMEDFEDVFQWTRERLSDSSGFTAAVGFSLGAAVVGSALRNNTALNKVAFLSPAMRPQLSMWHRYNTEDIRREIAEQGVATKPGSSVLLGQEILDSLRDTDLGTKAFAVGMPLLVCHGTEDSRIDISHTRELVAERGDASGFQYREFKGASHSYKPAEVHWQKLASTVTSWFAE